MSAVRTPAEILAKVQSYARDEQGTDVFGFGREVLILALPFAEAREYLKPEVTEDEWEPEDPSAASVDYLEFAIGKAQDHRGLSADRSVAKLRMYAWLLGRDDVVAAMDAAPYPSYGVPKLKAFAGGLAGQHWDVWMRSANAPDQPIGRMAAGEPCRPGCDEGCLL